MTLNGSAVGLTEEHEAIVLPVAWNELDRRRDSETLERTTTTVVVVVIVVVFMDVGQRIVVVVLVDLESRS